MLGPTLIQDYNDFRIGRARDAKYPTPDTSVVCAAPFLSMNFEQNGNVTACCYNRTHVLGTYPNDSLSDTWFGRKATELRDALSAHDLTLGCELCLGQLQSRNFSGTRMLQFDHLPAPDPSVPYPRLMEFELTNVCNLECVMCNGYYSSLIRKNREHLAPLRSPYDGRFVDQLEPFIPHLAEAKFLGGEPFMIQVYHDIWTRFQELNPDITVVVTTNGTILNERVRSLMDALDFRFVLSIDSVVKETYEAIRLNADFDVVMESLHTYLDYLHRKDEPLWMAVCPMRQNWQELPELVEFCNTNGIRLIFNTVLYPESCSLRTLPADELDHILRVYGDRMPAEATARRPPPPSAGPAFRPLHVSELHQNLGTFKDLVHQLEQWRDIARDKAVLSRQLAEGKGVTVLRPSAWYVNTPGGGGAELERPDQSDQMMRANLAVPGAEAWEVQVVHELPLKHDVRYCFRFRARADASRPIVVAAGYAESPWTTLGLYEEIALTDAWATHEIDFVSTETVDRARLYFGLGAHPQSVEFADLVLAEGGASTTAAYERRYRS